MYCSRERHNTAWAHMQSSIAAENPPWISLVLTLPLPSSGPGWKFITSVFVDRSIETIDPPNSVTDGFEPFANERLTIDRIFSSVIPSLPSGQSIACAYSTLDHTIQQILHAENISMHAEFMQHRKFIFCAQTKEHEQQNPHGLTTQTS